MPNVKEKGGRETSIGRDGPNDRLSGTRTMNIADRPGNAQYCATRRLLSQQIAHKDYRWDDALRSRHERCEEKPPRQH